jgi:glucosamine--fructose-6-phosphate aminotransferase (isomerizing)
MRLELASLSDAADATAKACAQPARDAAAALKDSPIQVWLGSGPSYGTALFSSAKVVEAAAVFAVGQDLEEWNHVEKYALPHDVPTFIIAPPGRSYWRAIELARQAKQLGRRLVAITQAGDTEIAPLADFVFPVVGEVREEFSPLLYHIASNLFASFVAENLGRKLFQADNPVFRAALTAYNAQSQPH